MRDPLLNINPIVLEPEEKESIESFAQSVYTQLEAQRESTGLGVFDNSVPESVAKLFKELKEQQPYGK
jgi:predicted RNA-binding protein (virulence factor B family)